MVTNGYQRLPPGDQGVTGGKFEIRSSKFETNPKLEDKGQKSWQDRIIGVNESGLIFMLIF